MESKQSEIKDIEGFLKALLKIPELGAKIRKERGLDENVQLTEEIGRMKDLIKRILNMLRKNIFILDKFINLINF